MALFLSYVYSEVRKMEVKKLYEMGDEDQNEGSLVEKA